MLGSNARPTAAKSSPGRMAMLARQDPAELPRPRLPKASPGAEKLGAMGLKAPPAPAQVVSTSPSALFAD